jgi:hypothetical protein
MGREGVVELVWAARGHKIILPQILPEYFSVKELIDVEQPKDT